MYDTLGSMQQATKKQRLHLTERDMELLSVLDYHPLTAGQILTLSASFLEPFTQLRLVQRRLRRLRDNNYLRCWPYATTGSSPYYYSLTQAAYRVLHGDDALLPGRRTFEEVAHNHHRHTWALGDVLVHLLVSAHRANATIRNFARENSLKITTDNATLYPDCAFQLAFGDGRAFNYVIELDNGTERVRSTKNTESLERKIRGYDRHQQHFAALDPRRYVVLFITTRSSARAEHILSTARNVMDNPNRTVFLVTDLRSFLSQANPVSNTCLRDNRGRDRGLVPTAGRRSVMPAVFMSQPAAT